MANAKLIIMRGLPGSGKTTFSELIIKNDSKTIRLNRDLLREMLHFKWTPKNEKFTIQAEELLASHFLTDGFNVIIDDTNLNPEVYEKWKHFTQDWEVVDFTDVSIEECIKRDAQRPKPVGPAVIMRMAKNL